MGIAPGRHNITHEDTLVSLGYATREQTRKAFSEWDKGYKLAAEASRRGEPIESVKSFRPFGEILQEQTAKDGHPVTKKQIEDSLKVSNRVAEKYINNNEDLYPKGSQRRDSTDQAKFDQTVKESAKELSVPMGKTPSKPEGGDSHKSVDATKLDWAEKLLADSCKAPTNEAKRPPVERPHHLS